MYESDKKLAERIASRQATACEELIQLHQASLFRFSCHLAGDAGLAEELVVEVFATAWEKMASYDGRSSLLTWLCRIAYRRFLDSRKRHQRANCLHERIALESVDSTGVTPCVELTKLEDSILVWKAVALLDPKLRVAVLLHYRDGMSFLEIANILESPIGTIKWRISEALGQLRLQLAGGLNHHGIE